MIDFGILGTGDPSCDLVMAWTFFRGQSRQAFKARFAYDKAVWQRAKGWTLWKALITMEASQTNQHESYLEAAAVIHELLSD